MYLTALEFNKGTNMEVKSTLLTLSLTFGLIPFVNATAQSSTSTQEMERIEVIGEVTLGGYKKQIINAKKDFYSLFNELTENSALKVKCKKEKKSSSNVRAEVCTPAYYSKVHVPYSSLSHAMSGAGNPIHEKRLSNYRDIHIDELTSLVNSNDELREKFFAYTNLLEKYQTKRAAQKICD